MREPDFWWKKPGLASALLSPLALVYGTVTGSRMRRAGFRAAVPVVCIGNFTLGGTGKTPVAIAVAKLLSAQGEKPVFLSRGYGGTLAGPVQVDPKRHRNADVGDEPLLLARQAPAVVARDRAAGARLAQELGASVIVMDDGLQNPALAKDVSLCAVDARRGFGNARVFPAGPLRAPLATQFARVQALLLIGNGAAGTRSMALARERQCPVLRARLEPSATALKSIGRRNVLAFAGIGDPEKFFTTLATAGITAQAEESFPDHHPYSEDDAVRLLARCTAEKLVPVTTEKDWVRLSGLDGARAQLAAAALTVPVTLIHDESLGGLLRDALKKRRQSAG
jgi:tetraacyldisaccharide 4'-kinase